MSVAYDWQRKLVKDGKCPQCDGRGERHGGYEMNGTDGIYRCSHCGGTGKPTAQDRADVAVLDGGTCVACGLPLIAGKPPNPDCKEHLLQEVKRLGAVVAALVGSKK